MLKVYFNVKAYIKKQKTINPRVCFYYATFYESFNISLFPRLKKIFFYFGMKYINKMIN